MVVEELVVMRSLLVQLVLLPGTGLLATDLVTILLLLLTITLFTLTPSPILSWKPLSLSSN